MPVLPESTVSLRWAIPFMRVTGASPENLELLAREGIGPKDFVNPDTRIRHSVSMELLRAAVTRLREPTLGIRAGERVEPGDFETLEYTYRSCATLREAMLSASRYMHLMHGAQEARLIESGDLATWELRITDDVEQLPAANDFALTSACWMARRYTGRRHPLREVRFRHREATDAAEYARVFDGAPIKLGRPHNALVFSRSILETPMSLAHSGLKTAFEAHAEAMLDRLKRTENFEGRVRRLVLEHLASDEASMSEVARRCAVSVATLRRRLTDEGTSHTRIVDQVRRELAQRYLADRTLAISEVAFLLGFSRVPAFYKAFRRWSQGPTPAEFRAEAVRRGGALSLSGAPAMLSDEPR